MKVIENKTIQKCLTNVLAFKKYCIGFGRKYTHKKENLRLWKYLDFLFQIPHYLINK